MVRCRRRACSRGTRSTWRPTSRLRSLAAKSSWIVRPARLLLPAHSHFSGTCKRIRSRAYHPAVCTSAQAYLTATADLLKSFPDFVYTRQGPIAYQDSPTLVGWTAVVRGTHSGAPYTPLPGVPPVSAKSPPVACQNDPEKILVTFASGSKLKKIAKIQVDALPGGKGFSGPIGFYVQAGGDPSKLPPPP